MIELLKKRIAPMIRRYVRMYLIKRRRDYWLAMFEAVDFHSVEAIAVGLQRMEASNWNSSGVWRQRAYDMVAAVAAPIAADAFREGLAFTPDLLFARMNLEKLEEIAAQDSLLGSGLLPESVRRYLLILPGYSRNSRDPSVRCQAAELFLYFRATVANDIKVGLVRERLNEFPVSQAV